jgi:hypothetical protein
MQIDKRKEGITATLISGLRTPQQQSEIVWCVDGKTYPYEAHVEPAKLPFKPRDVTPVVNPLKDPPEINTSGVTPDGDGNGTIYWRPAGATGGWHETTYQAKYTSPVALESLIALPDGTLLGNAQQYHGFFRFDPKTGATTYFGPHGPSQGARAVMDGKVYIAGYPSGVLYMYDPGKPWTSTSLIDGDATQDAAVNPRKLGTFQQASTHYASFLAPSDRGWLYYVGRRERDGVGSGIGYFDTTTHTFGGHFDGLDTMDPDGLAVLDGVNRVVFSGRLRDEVPQQGGAAQLVIFDGDLHEVARLAPKPGLDRTGEIYSTAQPGVIVGLIREELDPKRRKRHANAINAMYRYDVMNKKLLGWQDLGHVGATARRPSDGSLWAVIDHVLTQIDPETLEMTPAGTVNEIPSTATLAWQGSSLYATVGPELRRIDLSATH